jgi:hypothetical protein
MRGVMQRWEYTTIYVIRLDGNEITVALNKLGEEGWELVSGPTDSAWGHLFILKRPISN